MSDRANMFIWKLIDQYDAGQLTASDLEDGIFWILVNDGDEDPSDKAAHITDLVRVKRNRLAV